MLEECPTCRAQVLFTSALCPNCQQDRHHPDPTKVLEWRDRRLRLAEAQAQQEAIEEDLKKPNIPLRLSWILAGGGWVILRHARRVDEFVGEVRRGHSAGVMIGWAISIAGLVLLVIGLSRRRR